MTAVCERPTSPARSLTEGSVGPELISLAWPILCSGVAEILDGSVNVIWVGRELGDVSLAALSNANLLWGSLLVVAFGVSTAGTVWIGRSLGGGDLQGAKAAVATVVSVSAAVAIVGVLPMMVWARFLVECLGTPAAALPQAVEYLRVLLLSVPPIYLNAAVTAILQAAGDSKTGFYFAAASVAIDVALNPLLIVGVSPFPPLGIAGSALATISSQVILLMGMLVQVYRTGHPLRLLWRERSLLRVDWTRSIALVRDGGPMAIQVLWVSLEQMLMISLVNRFGAQVVAGYGAVVQLWNLIMMPVGALAAAITAIVAQNVGAGRWDRVRTASRLGLTYGILVTAVLVALAETLGERICDVFLPAGSSSLAAAVEINREATWALILLGGYWVWAGVQRATGAVWVPLVISAGVLAIRFPLTAAFLGDWQAQAIWWSFPVSAAATGMLAALYAYLAPRPSQKG